MVKNPPAFRRCGFNPWVRKICWRRKWQPTPVFWPGKPHGQRSPVGPGRLWSAGCKASDMTAAEQAHVCFAERPTPRLRWY